MQPVLLPVDSQVFFDQRGGGRALRVSWHHEAGVVVVSTWREDRCTGTVQLPAEAAAALVAALTDGLSRGYAGTAPRSDEAC